MTTLTFRTMEQKVLFCEELQGQLSDGYWENYKPFYHHKPWCSSDLRVLIGPEVGRDFAARKDNYGFDSKAFLDIVGLRMVAKVRLARAFGPKNVNLLNHLVGDTTGQYGGIPTYRGEYYDNMREKIYGLLRSFNVSLEQVREALANPNCYSTKNLRRDLAEIKKAIKVRK